MEEQDFKQHMTRAEAMMRSAQGTDADYWRGYIRGLRRAYHGEAFGTQEEHDLYVMSACSTDESRRRLGEGYADALDGVCEDDRPSILRALQKQRGWTQADAARRLGVGPSSVGRWLMKKPGPIDEPAWRLILLLYRNPDLQ